MTDTPVVERLDRRVEAIVAKVEHRPPHVLVSVAREDLPVVLGGGRGILEPSFLELAEDGVELSGREDPVDQPRQAGGAVGVVAGWPGGGFGAAAPPGALVTGPAP